jgi:hypothetical protein
MRVSVADFLMVKAPERKPKKAAKKKTRKAQTQQP